MWGFVTDDSLHVRETRVSATIISFLPNKSRYMGQGLTGVLALENRAFRSVIKSSKALYVLKYSLFFFSFLDSVTLLFLFIFHL